MNREQLWREFDALSPQGQQLVANFIAYLHSRTSQGTDTGQPGLADFEHEPFVGLWQDRDDLMDSTSWVRRLRAREWSNPCD